MTKTNEEIIREYIKDTPFMSQKLAEDLIRQAKKQDYETLKKSSQSIQFQIKPK